MKQFAVVAIAIVLLALLWSVAIEQPFSPLFPAAMLTFVLGLGHSVMGEYKLIMPLFGMEALAGDAARRKRFILRFVWHIATLLWWGIGALLAWMACHPSQLSLPFLWMVVVVFAPCGVVALIATRGTHTSWIYFLLIAALVAYRIWQDLSNIG